MPQKSLIQTSRSAPARRALITTSAALALVALTGCVDLLGDFRPRGGAGAAGSGGSDGCSCDMSGCPEPVCVPASSWPRLYGDANDQLATSVAVDGNDNILVAGRATGAIDFGQGPLQSGGDFDAFVAKLDTAGNPVFGHLFGSVGFDSAASVAADKDGNVLITGAFSGTVNFGPEAHSSNGDLDVFIVKLSPEGEFVWAKTFGDVMDQSAKSVTSDSQGNVLITGCVAGSTDFGGGAMVSAGDNDVLVIKLDPGGKYLWSLVAGGAGNEGGVRVVTDPDDNVLVTGYYNSTFSFGLGGALPFTGTQDVFLVKLDSTGSPLYERGYGGPGNDDSAGLALASDGTILWTGDFEQTIDLGAGPLTSYSAHDPFLASVDSLGNTLWSSNVKEPVDQHIYGSAIDPDGNIYLCGVTSILPGDANASDIYAVKASSNGAALWRDSAPAPLEQVATSMAIDSKGALVMTGHIAGQAPFGGTMLMSAGLHDVFVDKLTVPP